MITVISRDLFEYLLLDAIQDKQHRYNLTIYTDAIIENSTGRVIVQYIGK